MSTHSHETKVPNWIMFKEGEPVKLSLFICVFVIPHSKFGLNVIWSVWFQAMIPIQASLKSRRHCTGTLLLELYIILGEQTWAILSVLKDTKPKYYLLALLAVVKIGNLFRAEFETAEWFFVEQVRTLLKCNVIMPVIS